MRHLLICGVAVLAVAAICTVPPIKQDPEYHGFTDTRTVLGVPNFWNVISNVGFLAATIEGVRALRRRKAFAERWERWACAVFVAGIAAVAFGSAYYHWRPSDATLFWDRLPMTVVFMALFAMVIGERMGSAWGQRLLFPLLAAGVGSVVYWRATGDLRWYALVQYFPGLAMLLMLSLWPPRYTGSTMALSGLIAGYALAKLLEVFDRQIGVVVATGGHPWKHVAAAAGVWWYLRAVRRRCQAPAAP